ncbi:MAG: hypothetical protein DSM106950_30960 [Stigonema ocellatum SAG 48.90 = DSM 106950]|nr:hypothetical protein [Stigonema ocellatum SAG 48.90 = DSM 106950]
MARTEMKSLFTAITEEECATVSGGLTIILLNFDTTQLNNLQLVINAAAPGVDTSQKALEEIQYDVNLANAASSQ